MNIGIETIHLEEYIWDIQILSMFVVSVLSWVVWICSGFCCSHAGGLWALRVAGRSWRVTPVGTFEGHTQGRQGGACELGRGRSESGVLSPGTTVHKRESKAAVRTNANKMYLLKKTSKLKEEFSSGSSRFNHTTIKAQAEVLPCTHTGIIMCHSSHSTLLTSRCS